MGGWWRPILWTGMLGKDVEGGKRGGSKDFEGTSRGPHVVFELSGVYGVCLRELLYVTTCSLMVSTSCRGSPSVDSSMEGFLGDQKDYFFTFPWSIKFPLSTKTRMLYPV